MAPFHWRGMSIPRVERPGAVRRRELAAGDRLCLRGSVGQVWQ